MEIIEEAIKIEPIEQNRSANIKILGKTGPTVDNRPCTSKGLLKDGEYSSLIEGKRSLGSLIEEFDLSTTKFLSFGTRVTFKVNSIFGLFSVKFIIRKVKVHDDLWKNT
ncbi:hypothetical protein M9H77_06692 [Catharanthus roseus]|uniref:Uncharacterized protein n=1 Tax=Catharanthus roseus TaxID=4058 RepID=A0ACC0BST7_CATRO|nr:hypothetical protein M9H77_06692 [Catharanthus roseus]